MDRPIAALVLFTLLALGQAIGFTAAVADDQPAGTDTIESLTPEQAKALVAEWPGIQYRKKLKGSEVGLGDCLPLNALKTLDPATAQALAGWEGALFLDGLTELDAETAKALGEFQGFFLSLDGLTTLDADVAKALVAARAARVRQEGRLNLNGLTAIDADTAQELKGFTELGLEGLTTLDADTAEALAANGDALILKGLTTIDAETAKTLAAARRDLYLDGLTTLDLDTAKALAAFKSRKLWLNGLTTLDADTAGTLAESTCQMLGLLGLTSLKPKAAEKLAGFKGDSIFVGTKVKKKVAPLRQKLESFGPENPLTPETALTCKTRLLTGLTALESPDSVEIAKALAAREGPLPLPKLKRISPKTLTALLQKADVKIPPLATLELIPEPDGSPTEDFVIPEGYQEQSL
jgi:hypothetical protein